MDELIGKMDEAYEDHLKQRKMDLIIVEDALTTNNIQPEQTDLIQ